MNDYSAGPNQRIEPLPHTPSIHLHERAGFGSGGKAKKDPTQTIYNGGDTNINYPPIPGGFPPMTLFPPLVLPEIPEFPGIEFPPFIPGEFPANPGPDVPPDNNQPPAGGEFPFVYAEGGWWAFTSEIGWFKFTAPFPTSDPGGGQIWLSPA